jgi:hypothetical protein
MSKKHHKGKFSSRPIITFLKAKQTEEPQVLRELGIFNMDDMNTLAEEYLSKGNTSQEAIKTLKKKLKTIRKFLGVQHVFKDTTDTKSFNMIRRRECKNKYKRNRNKPRIAYIYTSSEDFYTILDGINEDITEQQTTTSGVS